MHKTLRINNNLQWNTNCFIRELRLNADTKGMEDQKLISTRSTTGKVVLGGFLVIGTIGFTAASSEAAEIIVNDFAAGPSAGVWYTSDVRPGGTASIVSLTGAGGNLENNAPLPTGAAKITTDSTNAAKAEVGVADSYGKAGNILRSLQVGYSYFKDSASTGSAEAAPSIKLTFLGAHSSDGFVTLIYEPYWNQVGFEGTSKPVSSGDWVDVAIDFDSGLFWGNGGFGEANSGGGPPLRTLEGWLAAFDTEFGDADLIQVSVGMGTFNPGQIGFFDNVSIAHSFGGGFDKTYNFEVAAVPAPASLGLLAVGLAGLGWARRRKA